VERSAQEDSIAKTRKTRLYGSLDCMAGSSAVALAARRLARRLCLGPQHTASDVTPRLNPARRDPRVLAPATHADMAARIECYLYVDVPAGRERAGSGVWKTWSASSFCTLLIIDMS
jgi:hypothetical protein